jgi:hypothetical protein
MTLREALVILDLSERTLEPSMLNISLKNRLEKTDLRNVTRVLEAYRKVNSFLNPTLDTQGDSKGTVIDEPVEDGPPIQTTKSAVPAMKSETGLRRDYVPVNQPNPTLLGASGHYEAGNTTVMIDPSDAPHQQVDPRQTSILIDDFNDAYQTPAPRVNSRQLAPLAVIGLGLLAFAGGLGGMAVVSKLVNPPPSITTSVTDPVDPNTVAIKPTNPDPSTLQNPSDAQVATPENPANQPSNPSVSVIDPPSSAPIVKPTTVQKPNPTVATPEISAPVKPTKSQSELEREAKAKAAQLEKARQAQLEKSRLAQVEKARLETINAAREKTRQAQLEKARLAQVEKARLETSKAAQEKARQANLLEARIKANKNALEKARQAQVEKTRQAQLEKTRQAANAQALAASRAKAAEQARVDARFKARQDARAKAAQEARANALAQARAKARTEQRARDATQAKATALAKARAQAKAQAKARSQAQAVVVNSSARNLSNNRSQFYAWDRNGAVLRYGSWSQIPQSIKTARAGTFRASVFVAASPSAMPDIKR